MTTSDFLSLFRKMSKILPVYRSTEKDRPSAVPLSSSASASSSTKEAFNISHTTNNYQPTSKKKKRSPSNPSPLFSPLSSSSSISSSTSSSGIKDIHDINLPLSPIYPWMMTPLPNSVAWVFRTGFTPQPDSSAISALYWCHHCDMHIQGTIDRRCEHCDAIFLADPSSSPTLPTPKKKGNKWTRSWGRFFS